MSENDEALIEKIVSHEADLVRIYRDMYSAVANVLRQGLQDDKVAALKTLKPPDAIEPSEAAAVLKSILGSTSEDKFHFEECYSVTLPNGSLLGSFVRDELDKIGIGYHDFWPYLRERGWLVT